MSFLNDGYRTIIEFDLAPTVKLKEVTVTPPGIDGGGEIDITTMRNDVWRTRVPKQLKTLMESSFTAQWDPAVYDDILDIVQQNGEITITFPDGSTLVFWGWLDLFEPGEHTEGEMPTAECTIIPSNVDASGNEIDPVYTAGPTTTTTP